MTTPLVRALVLPLALVAALGLVSAPAGGMAARAATLNEVRALAGEERYVEAMAGLDEYLRAEPGDVEARLLKGVLFTRLGKTDEAIGVFETLSTERPDLPEPLNNLAVLHAAHGRYELAREALTRAVELAPRYETAQENLGDVYVKLANLSYERAYSLDRRNEAAKDKAEWMTRVLDTTVGDEAREGGLTAPAPAAPADDAMRAAQRVAPAAACGAVGGIDSDDAANAITAWFVSKGLAARIAVDAAPDDVIYAVYVPPFEDSVAAEEAVRRMRRDGIVDIMRVRSGEYTNAISVGAYRNRGNAERRIETLSELGYHADLRPQRHGRTARRVEVLRAVSRQIEDEFIRAFPGYALHRAECPRDEARTAPSEPSG